MGADDHSIQQKEKTIKQPVMKAILSRPFFKKYGKKALVIYLCWCVVKGVLFLVAGSLLW